MSMEVGEFMAKKDKLDIIYEDKEIIVVNKPSKLLTISTDNEKERTLFHKVITYQKQKNKNNKIFIVHRLDRDTSGIVLFAKSEDLKRKFQDNWDSLVKVREYVAIVEGKPAKDKGTVRSWLKETKTLFVYSSNRMVAGVGLKDVIIIETQDAILACDKNDTQGVKNVFENPSATIVSS